MKRVYIAIIVLVAAVLCGCGNTDKLDKYYSGMQSFSSNVQILTEQIDMVDVNKEVAANQIAGILDKLLEQFRIMSELQVPSNFATCEELGDDAYNYMSEAVSLYKEWVANPDDEDKLQMAKENYERALTRVNYISVVLQGGVPQGDNILTYEEDITDFTPFTDDSSADDSLEEDEIVDGLDVEDEFAYD